MKLKTVKLLDTKQDIFITAEKVDEKIIRLDISDADNDSSIEVTVERAALWDWCNSLVSNFS